MKEIFIIIDLCTYKWINGTSDANILLAIYIKYTKHLCSFIDNDFSDFNDLIF